MTKHFLDLGVVSFAPHLRESWRRGDLWKRWLSEYPGLFDADDKRLAESQALHGYHFVEWLAAIQLRASTGFLSLIEKYEYKTHPRKQKIFHKYAPLEVLRLIEDKGDRGGVQSPDLFLYHPDSPEWLFCEVKGPGDRLREVQRDYFMRLAEVGQRPVGMFKLRETRVQ